MPTLHCRKSPQGAPSPGKSAPLQDITTKLWVVIWYPGCYSVAHKPPKLYLACSKISWETLRSRHCWWGWNCIWAWWMGSVHGLAHCLDTALRRASLAAVSDHVLPSRPRLSAGSSLWRLYFESDLTDVLHLSHCRCCLAMYISLTKQREGDLWDVASGRIQFPRVGSSSCPLSRWCHLIISVTQPYLLTKALEKSKLCPSRRVFHLSFQWTLTEGLLYHRCCQGAGEQLQTSGGLAEATSPRQSKALKSSGPGTPSPVSKSSFRLHEIWFFQTGVFEWY